ncbi:MAG: serine/threonine-protein kinase [Acidobacteriota bacterium]
MDPEQWPLIDSLFHRVVDLSPEARRTVYRDESISQALILTVEDLIASDPQTGDPQLEVIQGQVQRAGGDAFDINRVGQEIGDYALIRELGRGGQGVVYLARRRGDELRGQVAIKILRANLTGEDMQRRFRQERRILSGLDHPNIARFLDAGSTPDGWLFLALEAVDGEPIDRYCEKNELDLGARLDLFCRAAGAVQAAHRQLIIHRDIKASNLLVTEDGTPKLLDFGIAKLLDEEGSLAETRTGMRHLTPEAASPEQVLGQPLTTAVDVYSLGLLLYRLLTGTSAYRFENRTPYEIQRVVCESQPVLPSEVAGRSSLRGDLDAIILQALRKSPEERYASVEAMVEDICRYRRREPVRARPANFLYRANKVVRRHWRPLAVLTLFVLVSSLFVLVLRKERDRAIQGATSLLEILGDVQREGLDTFPKSTASKIPDLEGSPEVHADLVSTLGAIFHDLDDHPLAQANLAQAIELRENLGQETVRIAADRHRLGLVQLEMGRHSQARASFRRGYEEVVAAVGTDHWLAATCLAGLAEVDYEGGDFEASQSKVERVFEIYRRLLSQGKPDLSQAKNLVRATNLLGGIHYQMGNYEEALQVQGEGLDIAREILGSQSHEVETLLNNQGMTLRRQQRYGEAVEAFKEAIRINQVNLRSGSIRLGIRYKNLGNTYRRQGEVELALEHCQEALRMTTQFGGPDHRNIPGIESCLRRARALGTSGL